MYLPALDRLDGLENYLDQNFQFGRDDNGPMRHKAALDFCNKTAPFYIIDDRGFTAPMNLCLQNWLFQRWFVPYRSEVDFSQFIAKFISTEGRLPDQVADRVDLMVKLHRRACADADTQIHLMRNTIPAYDLDLWQIMPSFRAVAVVALFEDYPMYEAYVPQTSVWVVRTGDEERLSAPVCLDNIDEDAIVDKFVGEDGKPHEAVRTTLETAYCFLCALERREIDAFGRQPDPRREGRIWSLLEDEGRQCHARVEDVRADVEKDARRLGWEGEFNIEAPTSTWVDVDIYPPSFSGGFAPILHNRAHRDRMRLVRERSKRAFLVKHYS